MIKVHNKFSVTIDLDKGDVNLIANKHFPTFTEDEYRKILLGLFKVKEMVVEEARKRFPHWTKEGYEQKKKEEKRKKKKSGNKSDTEVTTS